MYYYVLTLGSSSDQLYLPTKLQAKICLLLYAKFWQTIWNCLPKLCFLHFLLCIETVEWLNFIKIAQISPIISEDLDIVQTRRNESKKVSVQPWKSCELIEVIWALFIKFSHSTVTMLRRKCRKQNFGKQFQNIGYLWILDRLLCHNKWQLIIIKKLYLA